MLKLQDLLDNGPLKKAKLLTNNSSLDRTINFVLILEVPEATKWLRGNELLLTSGYVFKDNKELGKKLVDNFAKKGVSALAIKPGQYIKEVPADLIEYAGKVNFPLIEIPSDMPYSEIMRPIFEILINKQYFQLKKVHEIHSQFFDLLLNNENIDKVALLLSKLINNPVIILDNCGNIRGHSLLANENQDILTIVQRIFFHNSYELEQAYFFYEKERNIEIELSGLTFTCKIIKVEANMYQSGYIFIIELNKQLDKEDIMAVQQATMIAAVKFNKEKAIFEAEIKLGSELFEDLIFGNCKDPESIQRRASYLNFNLFQNKVVFIITFVFRKLMKDEHIFHNIVENIFNTVHECLKNYSGGVLLINKSSRIFGLIGTENKEIFLNKLEELSELLTKKFQKQIDFLISVGSEYSELKSLKTSYEEALLASKVCLNFDNKINFYDESRILKLLFEMRNSTTLKNLYSETLEPLLKYDAANGTELVKTLEVFFNNNCNIRKTAETLFIHNNSVVYRLRKIENISGFDLKNIDDKLNLQVALKARIIYKDT